MKNKFMRLAVSLAMALSMLLTTAFSVSAAAPTIEEIEHKGNGRIKVEFYGDVQYKKSKVTVKDTSGKKYKVKNVVRDDDDIKFTIKNFKRGKTYKITVSGIREFGTTKYGKRTGKIKIPAAKKSGNSITREAAIDIAKKHAGNTWGASNFWDVDFEKDYYSGQSVWEVGFNGTINGTPYEFEYKIAVNGGTILSHYHEYDD